MKICQFILFLVCISTKSFSQYDTIVVKTIQKDTVFRFCNGQKCNGTVIDTFENGKIKFKASYINGLLNGKATEYFQNGNIRSTSNFDMGKNVGIWFFYYENGSIMAEYNYDFSSGKSFKSITYYPNGNIETKEEFTKDFSLLYYYSFNEKKDTTHKCIPTDIEKQEYEFISFYDSGLIKHSGKIQVSKNGQKGIGTWKWFDEKGNLIKEEKK